MPHYSSIVLLLVLSLGKFSSLTLAITLWERDISPWLKPRGFFLSQGSASCFSGNRLSNSRPHRSSIASTGLDGEPLRQNVERGIGVTIVNRAACRTHPFPYVQGKRVKDVLACMTGLGRGVPLIDLDQGTSVPPGFVAQLADKLTPSYIRDRLRQRVVLDHVLDGQALDAHHLVFVHNV